MGVDLVVFIGYGYVIPLSKITFDDEEFEDIIDKNKLNYGLQGCYGTSNFFDEPCMFIGFTKECEELLFTKVGEFEKFDEFTPISDDYFPYANGGRLPIVVNLDKYGEMNKLTESREELNKALEHIYSDNEDVFLNNVFYSKWLFSYFC